MKTRILAIILLWLIFDIYFFSVVTTLTVNTSVYLAYWLFDALLAGTIILGAFTRNTKLISWLMASMLLSFIPKLVSSIVLVLEDFTRLFRGFPPRSYAVSELALVIAVMFFGLLLFGVTRGRHYYKVRRETLFFDDLPERFDGFTITQLSDVHSGSFSDAKGVKKGLDLVNAQQSDMILFTGDLVNNQATEMDPWIPAFAGLEAPYGKYSVLGNHDYGDYMRWENEADQQANLSRLKQVHQEIGFKLLLNEATPIQKDNQAIALIGVENWGKGGFHKYGDLKKATANVPNEAFKILMSHDPSHWDAVTLGHHQPIHLTLSGHTHGAQFGFELFGFKWSPIKYVYKQWAGLYQKSGLYLYVNRGFGFLGLKGRIGIWPEIAVLTLKRRALV
ncbi:metallophosphoesterase [Mucilaginibacter sp. RCC_168]|uniref:metallophosphoesterase n=1 Tax=Mucilaginibacter sp. RCC_168 TaxID=3239221 RepID=UPI00352598EE